MYLFAEPFEHRCPNVPTVKLLLDKGANPETKAGANQQIPILTLDSDDFTPMELAEHLQKRRPTGMTALLRSYAHNPHDEDIFL